MCLFQLPSRIVSKGNESVGCSRRGIDLGGVTSVAGESGERVILRVHLEVHAG